MTERENALMAYHHKIPAWIPLSFDCLFDIGFASGNENGLISEDHRDVFGVKWSHVPDPTPDPSEPFLLQDIDEWRETIVFPEPKKWDWEKIRDFELQGYDGTRVLTWFSEEGLFDRFTVLAGFENALCWLMTDPEESAALIDRIADYKIELIECVAKYIKPDVFMFTDDVATKTGLFMSPDTYRNVIKPSHARVFRAIKENGMIVEHHVCGKFESLIDDYIEMGVESLFPAQALNDLQSIQKKYGDKITLVGGYDSQGKAGYPDCDQAVILKEVHRIVDGIGQGPGYICMPMIMDTKGNWALYEGSTRQKWFREEFYRCNRRREIAS